MVSRTHHAGCCGVHDPHISIPQPNPFGVGTSNSIMMRQGLRGLVHTSLGELLISKRSPYSRMCIRADELKRAK